MNFCFFLNHIRETKPITRYKFSFFSETFSDETISKLSAVSKKPALRAIVRGAPEKEPYTANGISYSAIRVGDKVYIPDITKLSR